MRRILLSLASLTLLAFGVNLWLVYLPVSNELGRDPRNAAFTIRAHYQWWLNPTMLVLDLRDPGSASTADLSRGLLQTAEMFHSIDRRFSSVILERSGEELFVIDGDDFATLGQAYSGGENPMYLLRTLPEKLKTPSGISAFGQWRGGLLGVMQHQMEDLNQFGKRWASGGDEH